jgi:RNA polymerase sigma-70 factor (ECF subfamily)
VYLIIGRSILADRSDEILAGLAKEGDMRAFEELFGRYKKPILNFIYRLIGNLQTAEEVALEVFMKVYANLSIYDTERKFATWIYTIARNLSKNALRDKKYFRDMSFEETIADGDEPMRLRDVIADPNARPDLAAQDDELNAEAQKVLDSMPTEYREVITLCSIQGMTQEEAAKIIGCSIATISLRLEKAKELFVKRLGLDNG